MQSGPFAAATRPPRHGGRIPPPSFINALSGSQTAETRKQARPCADADTYSKHWRINTKEHMRLAGLTCERFSYGKCFQKDSCTYTSREVRSSQWTSRCEHKSFRTEPPAFTRTLHGALVCIRRNPNRQG